MAANKHAGKKSLAQNDFLAPGAPTIGAATNVGTNRSFNDGAATVAFTPSALGAAATSYTVTSSPGGYVGTGASSPVTVPGLQSSVAYTFTVTATNASGTSPASAASASVTATTVPATMSAPVATTAVNQDTVSWTVPNTGGSNITTYRWTSSDGKTGTTTGTSVVVAQEGSTAQTYSVRAENANGVGVYSPDSNSVTTTPPFFPPFFPPYFLLTFHHTSRISHLISHRTSRISHTSHRTSHRTSHSSQVSVRTSHHSSHHSVVEASMDKIG